MYGYLIERIAAALAAAFPHTHLYGDSVRQDFRKPAFFIGVEEVIYGHELGDRFFADYQVKISYYEEKGREERETSFFQGLHDLAGSMLNALLYIGSEGPGLYGKNMRHKISDGEVLAFYVTYRLYGVPAETQTEMPVMNEIKISEGVR